MQGHSAPSVVDTVVSDSQRLLYLLTGLFVVGILGPFAVVAVLAPLWVTAALGIGLAIILRVPLFGTASSTRLETDETPEAVRSAFQGPRPPVLPFQWGRADSIESTETGGRYTFSTTFGLSETVMETEFRPQGDDEFDLVVTVEGSAWGTYHVSLDREGTTTVLDVTVTSDRRFGIRQLPKFVAANRYRTAALEVQGYRVRDRDRSLNLVGTTAER